MKFVFLLNRNLEELLLEIVLNKITSHDKVVMDKINKDSNYYVDCKFTPFCISAMETIM